MFNVCNANCSFSKARTTRERFTKLVESAVRAAGAPGSFVRCTELERFQRMPAIRMVLLVFPKSRTMTEISDRIIVLRSTMRSIRDKTRAISLKANGGKSPLLGASSAPTRRRGEVAVLGVAESRSNFRGLNSSGQAKEGAEVMKKVDSSPKRSGRAGSAGMRFQDTCLWSTRAAAHWKLSRQCGARARTDKWDDAIALHVVELCLNHLGTETSHPSLSFCFRSSSLDHKLTLLTQCGSVAARDRCHQRVESVRD
ncbi:hypothetical protein EVAR_59715_1 [Eumeta japonica]|uniref:Uncharacterized protein n=1 Tax=Eumeta variegata TaxID=151549 RepID=A0A4C1XGY6_EUMVA|nr:hypothetical protein EVAR_59715_1 [Eumeta japonica]